MPIIVKVPNYEEAIGKVFDDSLVIITAKIEKEAKLTSPVDTGFYRNNIKVEGKDKIVANAEYSKAVEYGFPAGFRTKTFTYKNGRVPNPVMRNSARKIQKEVPSIVGKLIK